MGFLFFCFFGRLNTGQETSLGLPYQGGGELFGDGSPAAFEIKEGAADENRQTADSYHPGRRQNLLRGLRRQKPAPQDNRNTPQQISRSINANVSQWWKNVAVLSTNGV